VWGEKRNRRRGLVFGELGKKKSVQNGGGRKSKSKPSRRGKTVTSKKKAERIRNGRSVHGQKPVEIAAGSVQTWKKKKYWGGKTQAWWVKGKT